MTKGLCGSYKPEDWRLLSVLHFSVLVSSSLHPHSKKTATKVNPVCFPLFLFTLFLTSPFLYFSFVFFCAMPSANESHQLHHYLLTDLYQGKSKPASPHTLRCPAQCKSSSSLQEDPKNTIHRECMAVNAFGAH